MPSVEPATQVNQQMQPSPHQENASSNNGQSERQQQDQNQQSTSSNGAAPTTEEIRDPDRQLIPADRSEHVEDAAAPVDLPTVREFTQNDKINKFLLNSFLQRLNETDLSQFRENNTAEGEDQEQDFEA